MTDILSRVLVVKAIHHHFPYTRGQVWQIAEYDLEQEQEKISEIMFEKSKEYATRIYQENEALIHSGKVNYMFLEIDKVTRAYVQPIGK